MLVWPYEAENDAPHICGFIAPTKALFNFCEFFDFFCGEAPASM